MEEAGLDVSRMRINNTQHELSQSQSVQQPIHKPNIILGTRKVLQQQGGSKDGNREHEVGGHNNYDDIDDDHKLKR